MNYELKSIQPLTVFLNAIRIFLIVGFIVAILSFFILPNPNIRISLWWQKILATVLFTVVYAFVVSVVLSLIAFLYNFWTANFGGIKIHLEQTEE
jgi:hypothetical protein